MSVMVYSRLGDVLRDKNMSVGDLARRIAERFEGQAAELADY